MHNDKHQIRVADSGTTLEMQVLKTDGTPYPLNDSEVLQFKFQKPNGQIVYKNAKLVTDGFDGKVCYITSLNDFDKPGTWRYQVYFERAGVKHHTNSSSFRVYPNL